MEDIVIKQYESSKQRLSSYLQNHQSRVPLKIIQKLGLLQQSIENQEIGQFDQLLSDEVTQLLNHSIPVQIRMFIEIVNSFIFQEVFVEGKIDIKGKSGLFWNSKEVKINLQEQTIQIARKKTSKPQRLIILNQCSLKWIGQIKNRHVFQLLGKEIITFGSEDLGIAEKWFNYAKQCCNSFDDDLLKKTKTLRNSLMIKSNEDLRDLQPQTTEGEKQQLKQSQTMIQQQASEQNKINTLSKSDIFIVDNSQKQQQNQIDGQSKLQQQQQQQQQNQEKEQIQEPKQEQQQQQQQQQQSTKQIENINNTSFVPAIFTKILENKQQFTKQYLMDDYDYNLISFKNKLRLLQHKSNALINKAIIIINSRDMKNILTGMICPDQMKNWNSQIEQSQLLDAMPQNNSIIISEFRKKFGLLYLRRMFTYMRHYFYNEEGIFIIDKSLPYNSNQDVYSVEGQITQQIIAILNHQDNQTLLIILTETSNGGYASKKQDSEMTLNYLNELVNFESYLLQKEYNLQIPFYLENFNFVIQPTLVMSETLNNSQHLQFNSPKQLIQQPEPINVQIIEDTLISEQKQKSQFSIFKELLDQVANKPEQIWTQALHIYIDQPFIKEPEYYTKTEDNLHIALKNDWEIIDKGGMRFYNQHKLETQKEVFSFILRKIGSNLLTGKSIINISLPVTVFEKRSNLERLCYSMSYLWILEKAGECVDVVEQMKYLVCYSMSLPILYLTMEKPFNPILGETYQGYCNGNLIFAEQISHHPPVAAIYIKGRNFKLHGHLEQQAQFNPNSITGRNVGYLQVDFTINNQSFILNNIPGCVSGTTYGSRIFYLDGNQWIINEENRIIADMLIQPFPGVFTKKATPQDWIDGNIYKMNDKEFQRYKQEGYRKYSGVKGQGEKISTISGRWTQSIIIDDKERINWSKDYPYYLVPEQIPLASDCKFREDIISLKMDDLELSQQRKEKLEIIQRNDKKLRTKKK